MKRIGVFSYKGPAGRVEGYVRHILGDMRGELSHLIIVASRDIGWGARETLYGFADELLVCGGAPLAAAYQTGIGHISQNGHLHEYDELVLFDDSFYGPLRSFGEIFREAGESLPGADLWGISSEYVSPDGIIGCGFNLQPYFLVVREGLLHSEAFLKFWSAKGNTGSDGALRKNLSQHFAHTGFQVGALYRTDYMDVDAAVYDALALLRQGFPIIKRAVIIAQYHDILSHAIESDAAGVLEYVAKNTGYDASLILDDAIRASDPYNLLCNLGNHFILPEDVPVDGKKLPGKNFALLVFHLHYGGLSGQDAALLSGLPDGVDILVTTTSEEKAGLLRDKFKNTPALCGRADVVVSGGDGREVAALLVGARPFLKNYKYIGFTHDLSLLRLDCKNVEGLAQMVKGDIFGGGPYVRNVLETFEGNPRLGLLLPHTCSHGTYFGMAGRGWGANYNQYLRLCQRLGIEPGATADSMCISLDMAFWCRYDALRPLFDYPWVHGDFPAEPMPADGTISHAIGRSLPFIAKHNGYYCGFVSTPRSALASINNGLYIGNYLVKALEKHVPLENSTLNGYTRRISDKFTSFGKFNNSSYLDGQARRRKKDASVIRRSRYFNRKWYVGRYPECRKYKGAPEYHYLEVGWKGGFDPSPKFSSGTYLRLNGDVKRSGMCPLLHYERFGRREGRPYKVEGGSVVRGKPGRLDVRPLFAKAKDFLRKVKYYLKNPHVDGNKIVFRAFQNDYTCNPKYICEEMVRQRLPYDIVWIARPDGSANPHFPKGARVVKAGTGAALNETMSARVLVDNGILPFRSPLFKKKRQVSINTWHGSFGFKRLDGNQSRKGKGKKAARLYGKVNDYVVSNSTFEDGVFRDSYWKKAKFIQCGHPRNDILVSCPDEKARLIRDKVHRACGIPEGARAVLYAPTFRERLAGGHGVGAAEMEEIDLDLLCDSLEEKFGGEWCVLFRAHNVNARMQNTLSARRHRLCNATAYPDIQELMLAADAGVTDYSSWILDFMLTRKPAFLYTPDYGDYELQRGFYYPLSQAPFPIGESNVGLARAIGAFDAGDYERKVASFLEGKGSREDGHGSKAVVELIKQIMGEGKQAMGEDKGEMT